MNDSSSTTVSNWLAATTKLLSEANIATARLDCLVFLSDELGQDKSWILAYPEHELQIEQVENLNTKIVQRAQHTPLAYLRGKTEFYGREFVVNEHVLEPRPESETIIELLKSLLEARPLAEILVVDIGTGSGALAITAKLELPNTTVVGIDIDPHCLTVAKENAQKLDADVTFLLGNLLEPLADMRYFDTSILLCNLPYVPDNFHINRAATHEPDLALFGGPDGLDLYRTLFSQTKTLSVKPAVILAESLPPQHESLAAIAEAANYHLETTDDFIQLFVLATLR